MFPQGQHLKAATHSLLQGTSARLPPSRAGSAVPPWQRQECAPRVLPSNRSPEACGMPGGRTCCIIPGEPPVAQPVPRPCLGDQLCALSWSNPAPSRRAGPARVPLRRVTSPSPVTKRKQRRERDVPPEDADHPVPLGGPASPAVIWGFLAMNVFNLARPINSHPPRLPPRPPGAPAGSAPWKSEAAGRVSSLDVEGLGLLHPLAGPRLLCKHGGGAGLPICSEAHFLPAACSPGTNHFPSS